MLMVFIVLVLIWGN